MVEVDPDQERAQDYLKRVVAPPDMDAVSGSDKGFRRHIEWFEDDLHQTGGPWICGDQFTLADICVGVIFDRVEFLDREYLWDDLPVVSRWFATLKERPSYHDWCAD